jgi:hypothetical protein
VFVGGGYGERLMEDREPLSDLEIEEILNKVDAHVPDPRGVRRLVAELRVWKSLVEQETEYAREVYSEVRRVDASAPG